MSSGYQPTIHLHNGHFLRYGLLEIILSIVCYSFLTATGLNATWSILASSVIALIGIYRVIEYFENIRELKSLAMNRFSTITLSAMNKYKASRHKEDALYLGEGFVWGPEHCQGYHEIKYLMHKEKSFQELSEAGGLSYIHNVGHSKEKIQIHNCPEHTAIIGTTGIGKTRLFELLLAQRIQQGQPVVIIDPKGDKDLMDSIYQVCLATSREQDFSFFSLAHPQVSATINPLANWASPGEVATRITSIMPQGTNSKPFVDFCYDVLVTILQVMRAADQEITLQSLYKYTLFERDALVKIGQNLQNSPDIDTRKKALLDDAMTALQNMQKYDPTHFAKMTASLVPVLKSLVSDHTGSLLSPPSDGITWSNIITQKKVVYFGLNSMADAYLASNVGKLIVQDLIAYVGNSYAFQKQHETVNLFVDEFYSVAYEGYVDALNKSRAAGLRLTLGMQTMADIEATLSDPVRRQIYGNITNKIFLRILDVEQAEEVIGSLGQCQIPKVSRMRSVSANHDSSMKNIFTSGYTERLDVTEVDLLPAEILTSLPKGQAILITEGNPPFKLRLPLLDKTDLPQVSYFEKILRSYAAQSNMDFEGLPMSAQNPSAQAYKENI